MLNSCSGFEHLWPLAQAAEESLRGGFRVEDVASRQPCPAQLNDAVLHMVELIDCVGVSVHADRAAQRLGEAHVSVRKVGACWSRVVLHGDTEPGGRNEDLCQIDFIRIASEELAAGGMRENVDVRVAKRTQHALASARLRPRSNFE